MASDKLYLQAIQLGTMTGMRSQSGLAALSVYAAQHQKAFRRTGFKLLAADNAPTLLAVAALGEAVVDKLPFVPSRIKVGPLIGRATLGAISGAALFASKREDAALGALLGGGAAVASTYIAYFLRQGIDKGLHVPDLLTALLEDGAVFVLRRSLLQTLED